MKVLLATKLIGMGSALLLSGLLLAPATAQQNPGDRSSGQPSDRASQEMQKGTPVLGVMIAEQSDKAGAEIVQVWPGSAAEQAGLEAGDRIAKVGSESVDSAAALRNAIMRHAPGDKIALEIQRNNQSQSIDVRLGGADGLNGWSRHGASPESNESAGWLGVRLEPESSESSEGVVVMSSLTGSPAHRAGIQSGDEIRKVDEQAVTTPGQLQEAIASHRPGEKVRLEVARGDSSHTIDVELGAMSRWRGDVSRLSETEARELLQELIAAPFNVAEELLTDEEGHAKHSMKQEVDVPKQGVAVLAGTKGHQIDGTIVLREGPDGLHLEGQIRGLEPGKHGFHIHEFGDVRDPEGKSAGGHFNPQGTSHGGPSDESHHAGDLGNIEADPNGVATVDKLASDLKLHWVVGRTIVVHAGADDFKSQPSGDAGPRVALGIIGIAEESSE